MRACRPLATFAVAVTSLALLAACNSQLLGPATNQNVVDTVTLYALLGTPFYTPSAYVISGVPNGAAVRADLSSFDFAFKFDSLGRPVLLPANAAGIVANATTVPAGLELTTTPFANLTLAPTEGYVINQPLVVASGSVLLGRSRSFLCPDGTTQSVYGKLHVLAIDTAATARTIQFEILTDQNCGYLGLTPGTPTQ